MHQNQQPWHMLILLALAASLSVALLPLSYGTAQGGVTAAPDRDGVFVRIAPGIGHEVLGTLNRGQHFAANGRTADNQWLRFDFNGQEGWVGVAVLVISGSVDVLPVNNPVTLPLDYGDGPRAGQSGASGAASIRLSRSGMRLRAGPSEAYFVIANAPRYEIMALTGRTYNNTWLQVSYRGTLGWIANLDGFIELRSGTINAAPINGIVASGPIPNEPTPPGPSAERDALLNAMLIHVNRSMNRLDMLEGIWRNILYGNYACAYADSMAHPQYYIPRSGDLLAYPELDVVIADMNEGLEEMGRSIEQWRLLCELHYNNYPITEGVVNSGIEAIYHARRGLTAARERIEGFGVGPTPEAAGGFTPAPPVATVTPAGQLPDVMAFDLQDNRVLFVPQFLEPALGCNWQGLGGQVFGLLGEPLIGYTIRVEGVTDQTFFFESVSGVETRFGPSGWDMQVSPEITTHVYTVTLYQDGRRVSDPKTVSFPGDCNRNLGIMNFVQISPLE